MLVLLASLACVKPDGSVLPGETADTAREPDTDTDGAPDADGDGDPADEDCDDADPTVHHGADELEDGRDDDCDGLVDEDSVAPGDVWFAEVMATPEAVPDADGEWVELVNASGRTLDLAHWRLSHGEGGALLPSLVVPAGGRVVLGAVADPTVNGGAAVDATWPSGSLSIDDVDQLVLTAGEVEVARFAWSVVDGQAPGASIQLDADVTTAADAADPARWCGSLATMAGGDRGTPAKANWRCGDEDGDGVLATEGDCDDDDAAVGPGAAERWNGVDDDCDGTVDDLVALTAAAGSLSGQEYDYLGMKSVGVGDVDGDGAPDLLVGAPFRDEYDGAVFAVSGRGLSTWAGEIEGEASLTITGLDWPYNYFGVVAPHPADVTGDGVTDLAVAAEDGDGGEAWVVFDGPVTGNLSESDAALHVDGFYSDFWGSVLTEGDFDGDGTSDVVYGSGFASDTTTNHGVVAVFGAVGLSGAVDAHDADLLAFGTESYATCGSGVAVGDLDGDSYADLVVTCEQPVDGAGSVYVLPGGSPFGGAGSVADLATLAIEGTGPDRLGDEAPVVADLDGDGDLDVAENLWSNDGVLVFSGPGTAGTLTAADAAFRLYESLDVNDEFGWSMAAGDTDGDGVAELAVAGAGYSNPDHISIWIFEGGELDRPPIATVAATNRAEYLGAGLAFGDIDGDGLDELVAAADQALGTNGEVYVIDDRR